MNNEDTKIILIVLRPNILSLLALTNPPFQPPGTIYGPSFGGAVVLGVGDVELYVKKHYSRGGRHRILLRDVLYCPTATCNILGGGILDDYDVVTDWSRSKLTKLTKKSNGANAGLIDHLVLGRLRLSGYRANQTSLDKNAAYVINATWSDEERERWRRYKLANGNALPALSLEERAWLKRHYGNEYKFLRALGLQIYKDEDRREGRAILKAVMINDGDREDEEEHALFLRDLELAG